MRMALPPSMASRALGERTEGNSPAYSGSDSAASSCAAATRGAQGAGGGARGGGGGGSGASPLRQWTQLPQPKQLAQSGQAKHTPGGFFLRSSQAQWLFFGYAEQFLSGGSRFGGAAAWAVAARSRPMGMRIVSTPAAAAL